MCVLHINFVPVEGNYDDWCVTQTDVNVPEIYVSQKWNSVFDL